MTLFPENGQNYETKCTDERETANGLDNNYPKLHNAMWPGVVGKGTPDSEPIISLDRLLELTANAELDGQKFEGVDLWLADPHFRSTARGTTSSVWSITLPATVFWSVPSSRRSGAGRRRVGHGRRRRPQAIPPQVKKACVIGRQMRELGIRPSGLVRINSSASVEDWDKDPDGNTKRIAETFREAAKIAQDYGEVLAAEGEVCWGGMHSWRENVKLLELVGMPGRRRLPGRHGAQHALRPRRQRREGPPAARRTMTGPTRQRSTSPTSRSPTHSGHGRWISTLPRTTARPSVPAPRGNRAARAGRAPQWAARYHQTRRLLAPRRKRQSHQDDAPHLLGRLHISERRHGSQETWNAVLGAMLKVRDAHGWRE